LSRPPLLRRAIGVYPRQEIPPPAETGTAATIYVVDLISPYGVWRRARFFGTVPLKCIEAALADGLARIRYDY
jgi:hypothetical protein